MPPCFTLEAHILDLQYRAVLTGCLCAHIIILEPSLSVFQSHSSLIIINPGSNGGLRATLCLCHPLISCRHYVLRCRALSKDTLRMCSFVRWIISTVSWLTPMGLAVIRAACNSEEIPVWLVQSARWLHVIEQHWW